MQKGAWWLLVVIFIVVVFSLKYFNVYYFYVPKSPDEYGTGLLPWEDKKCLGADAGGDGVFGASCKSQDEGGYLCYSDGSACKCECSGSGECGWRGVVCSSGSVCRSGEAGEGGCVACLRGEIACKNKCVKPGDAGDDCA